MKKYLKRTLKNKLISLVLILVTFPTLFIDGQTATGEADATAFIFILIIAIPLFFARENCINEY